MELRWLLFLFLSVILIYNPFKRGMFFSEDHYLVSFFVCLLFVLWGIIVIVNKKEKDKLPIGYYWLFFLPFMYVATYAVAVSPSGNFDNLIAWTSYICFFIMLLWIRTEDKMDEWFPYAFSLLGTFVSFFALAGVWGWTNYLDVMLGDRTAGPFQYANTFAVIVGVFWIYALVNLSKKRLQWQAILVFSFPITACAVGFFHSYSRGAWLLFPIVWLVGLVCLRMKQQMIYVTYTFISLVTSFLVFRNMVSQEQMGEPNPGLVAFIIGTVFMATVAFLHYVISKKMNLERPLGRLDKRIWYRFIIPSLSLVIGVLLVFDLVNEGFLFHLFPAQFQDRVSNINLGTTSVLGRLHVYADAWMLSKQSPVLGFGGEGWKIVYSRYQSLPYYNNEIHNGYLEILLNTGWTGFMVFISAFLILFGQVIIRLRKERNHDNYVNILGVFLSLIFIFMHAAIDFDFSFGSVWFIVFYLFAMGVPLQPGWFSKLRNKNERTKNQLALWVSRAGKLAIPILVLMAVFFAFRFYDAERAIAKINDQTGPIDVNVALEQYSAATKMNPYKINHWLRLADAYVFLYENLRQDTDLYKMIEALNQAENLEPDNSHNLIKISGIYTQAGLYEEAVPRLEKALDNDRFNVEVYNRLVDVKYNLSLENINRGQVRQANEYFQEIIGHYEDYTALLERWKDTSIPDRRPLNLAEQSYFMVADAYRALGHYASSLALLDSRGYAIDPDLMENGSIANKPFELVVLRDVLASYTDHTIIMSVKDEATKKLTDETRMFLQNLGSHIEDLGDRGSYVAIIFQGKLIYEEIDNNAAIDINPYNTPELNDVFMNKPFSIHSAGYNVGNTSSIVIDGVEYSNNYRGFNVAVFYPDMTPIKTFNFDTYSSEISIVPK